MTQPKPKGGDAWLRSIHRRPGSPDEVEMSQKKAPSGIDQGPQGSPPVLPPPSGSDWLKAKVGPAFERKRGSWR